uniref:Cytochrome c biogenesis FN n=1 Tax=Cunninghamia lanceolata TaxID=28977 RepID=A0A8F4MF63_CUNLA|nr:cytochrome c biogenesis FN [Cunninghamia lanceolata]BDG69828.1 cytochrome c biogenesis FN [Cunninghamia lanceolata var. konishii]
MSVNELCHYLLLPGLSVAFAYDRKQPPAFGASPHFLCTLLSLSGPSFRHTPSNSPNYNVFTNSNANAPLLYQIPGAWSNHEGSIPPRCRIPGFYGFPFRYRVQPHNVSERGRETAFCSFVSSSVKPEQRQSSGSGAEPYRNYGFEQARTSAPALLYNYSKGWGGRKEEKGRTIHLSHYIRGWGGAPTFLRVRSTAPAPASASASQGRGRGGGLGWVGSRATLHPIYSGGGHSAAPLLILGLRRPRNSSDRTRRSRESRSTSREMGRNRTLNRLSALLDRNIEIGRRGRVVRERHALLDRGGSGGSRAPTYIRSARSGLGATPTIHRVLHLARDAEERAEQRISGAVGIALFSPLSPSASSNPLVRNSFVRTESLAESNPVLQDPVLAIHPPCIYAGDVASAMGFGLCIYKMMNGIVALYSPMQREGNGALCSAGCVGAPPLYNGGAHLTQYQSTGGQSIGGGVVECSARPLPPEVGRGPDIGRGPIGRGTIICRTAGANTVVSDPKRDRERIRIRIPTRRRFFTVGILPGSWWAHHELGRGGRWFRDPVENASPMPWVLATARIHPVILPKVYLWTSFPNIVTFSCRVLGTFLVRSGLLASVHSSATDSTRGIFSWRFLLLITGISPILFFQIRGHRSIERTLFSKPLTVRRSFMRSCYQCRGGWEAIYICWASGR